MEVEQSRCLLRKDRGDPQTHRHGLYRSSGIHRGGEWQVSPVTGSAIVENRGWGKHGGTPAPSMDQSARTTDGYLGSGDCQYPWPPDHLTPGQNPSHHRSQTAIKSHPRHARVQKAPRREPTMRGGSLTRYHTPVVTKQDGKGLAEDLIKVAGLQEIQRGKSAAETWADRGAQLTRGLKRKAPAMAWAVGKHKAKRTAQNTYKRATQRVRDIFGL